MASNEKTAYEAALKRTARALEQHKPNCTVTRYDGKFALVVGARHAVSLRGLGHILPIPLSRSELEALRTLIDTVLADTTDFS
jgi:hypothetical protein